MWRAANPQKTEAHKTRFFGIMLWYRLGLGDVGFFSSRRHCPLQRPQRGREGPKWQSELQVRRGTKKRWNMSVHEKPPNSWMIDQTSPSTRMIDQRRPIDQSMYWSVIDLNGRLFPDWAIQKVFCSLSLYHLWQSRPNPARNLHILLGFSRSGLLDWVFAGKSPVFQASCQQTLFNVVHMFFFSGRLTLVIPCLS